MLSGRIPAGEEWTLTSQDTVAWNKSAGTRWPNGHANAPRNLPVLQYCLLCPTSHCNDGWPMAGQLGVHGPIILTLTLRVFVFPLYQLSCAAARAITNMLLPGGNGFGPISQMPWQK